MNDESLDPDIEPKLGKMLILFWILLMSRQKTIGSLRSVISYDSACLATDLTVSNMTSSEKLTFRRGGTFHSACLAFTELNRISS